MKRRACGKIRFTQGKHQAFIALLQLAVWKAGSAMAWFLHIYCMTEKLSIHGKDIWVTVDPHAKEQPGYYREEYFTVSYHAIEPLTGNNGILIEEEGRPKLFTSPVEAVEYASEKLLGLL